MEFPDGRGQHMQKVKSENRKRIVKWMKKTKGRRSKRDCSKELGLSFPTVLEHMKEIQKNGY